MSGRWTLGEVFVLRHAGFPFDWLESLGFSTALVDDANRWLADEQALLDALSAEGNPVKAPVLRALLANGTAPRWAPAGSERLAVLSRLRAGYESLQARHAQERSELRSRLRERAAEPSIQEAVFLSSPAMFDNVWARYLRGGERKDTSDGRRVERQVYTYLQRFCAKNETTSFFGPISYGERTDEDGFDVRTVASGDTSRRTFFSFWAVTELARAVGRERTLRPHLPLRLNPLFTVSPGRAACEVLKLEVPLSESAERLLSVLSEHPTPAAAAKVLGLPVEDAERAALPLVKGALLLWGLPFRPNDFATFESVRDAVAALPELEARSRWLERLDTLSRLKAEFQTADLTRRKVLLLELEACFTEATGKPARRGDGQVYADRLILYEEASSPFRLRFGRRFTAALESALSGPLELSAAYGERVQQGFREQVREALGTDERPVDLLDYAVRLRPDQVTGSRFSPVPPVLLDESPERARTLPVDFLGTSTPGGRYALPDVCLAAKGDGAGFEVMLARVHHHLLLRSWLSAFFPSKERYAAVASRWLESDPSARGLVGLSIRRRNKGFYVFPGRRLVYSVSDVLDVEDGALTPGDVKVLPTSQGPVLVDGKGERLHLYLPLDDFSSYPPFAALAHPQVLHAPLRTKGQHLPRLSIGGAVYQRERWELSSEHLARPSGFELFLAVQRERHVRGWPRFVFMRSTKERKPYLIDTASPFALDLLSHLAREAERLSVEEMYPAPEQLWLRDERGRYTCELRMQFTRWSEGASPL
ncbi:lantibiotic dehydratase [Myxococcus fulvus]|uniref:lantibiotic dehydratase n=1 Tax=Myxococcus TaxID=32 RepID=UPI0020C15CF2|nr:lantibiotic dehydratase [Myxococcus fulvus]MCK8504157.1 lantibiotic dehydratase family protein [Myxococcus fulvus]